MRKPVAVLVLTLAAACRVGITSPADPDVPTSLSYRLMPSGDPVFPQGILLEWTPPASGRALTYEVYARAASQSDFGLRATTTSPSFHDAGLPQLEYFVQALDQSGRTLGVSDTVMVDERNRLPSPRNLVSVTLNGGVELSWDPNAFEAGPETFDFYRVYSTSWSPSSGCDLEGWALEGTTVSDGFVARNLANGVTRCFATSAISLDGHESLWSNVREDTPRHDARNVVLDDSGIRPATSGFVFGAGAGVFGTVVSDTAAAADIVVARDPDGVLAFVAAREAVSIAPYGTSPVSELTSIDRAPVAGYTASAPALAGHGYVVRAQYADGFHYAAIRVVHVGGDYVLFDFAFQSQASNPELLRVPVP